MSLSYLLGSHIDTFMYESKCQERRLSWRQRLENWQAMVISEDKGMCGFSQKERELLVGKQQHLVDTFKKRKSGKRVRSNIQRRKRK